MVIYMYLGPFSFNLVNSFHPVAGSMDHVRVHPKFLHSNATSHKWALGGFCLWPPFCLLPLFPHTHCLDIQFPQQEKKIPPGLTKYKICFGCWTAIAELLDNAIDEVKEQSFLSSFFAPL